MSYIKDLKNRKEKLKVLEEKAYQKALKNTTLLNINELNNLRMSIKIIDSRIENFGKEGTYIEEIYLPFKID